MSSFNLDELVPVYGSPDSGSLGGSYPDEVEELKDDRSIISGIISG